MYALVPSHPNATKNGYVLLHRVIVENEVGRLLTSEEVVHHINHNPYDCRLCNLKLMTKYEHRILHDKEKESLYAIIICPECENLFIKKYGKDISIPLNLITVFFAVVLVMENIQENYN